MPRRASLFVFLGLAIALVFVTGISAGAEPDGSIWAKKVDVADAQDRLVEIRLEASSAEAAYNNALYEMNQLNGQITRTTEDLRAAKERLAVAKKALEERAAQVYKSGNVAFMDVLVGVDNFSEFASRLNLWVRLLDRERAEFLEVREARNDLAARRDSLEAQREQRVAAVETAIAQRERANEAKAQAEAYLNSLNAELRDAIQAAQDRQAAQARAAAATMVEKSPEPVEEPEPIPEVQVSQVKQARVPRADLQSERAAAERQAAARAAAERAERLAERRAAEREAARKAAKQAAAEREAARLAAAKAARQEARVEAQRQAELAAQRAAERQAARKEAERQAELAARRAEIEEAAAEQAAAEREAARLAAERRAERRAEQREAERRAEERAAKRAEASASASAAAEEAAAERGTEKRAEASASASASAPNSKGSRVGGGGRGDGAGASSASATASASASGAPAGGGVSGSGEDVLAVADDHLGTPYGFSPPGPCVAFEAEDCSCFTMLVFQEFGIALPDSPGGQMGYGTPVHGAPQAGDLLFWSEDGSGYITHVGIAMGDGTTIHAQVHNEVTITSINDIAGYVGARRLL
ncbi:MAG TPA: NlpC/P60 family protein [Rubrobacter sp.]|nr:NlpC/P60 family protein [Rubrobacter sp.]